MVIRVSFFGIFVFPCFVCAYECGQIEKHKTTNGEIELRVDCGLSKNFNFVSEYKGKIRNGMLLSYDKKWRIHDSVFFIDGKKEGQCLIWDTLGNIISRKNYSNGKLNGESESFYSPGHPSLIKNYNDSGQEEGLWQEWWPNGNKKLVAQCHKGLIISDEEYFPNGNLRLRKNRRPAKKIRVKGTSA